MATEDSNSGDGLETLVLAERRMRDRGFDHEFQLTDDHVIDADTGITYDPVAVEIVSTHREEGLSNPTDESLLLALRAPDGTCGLLVTTYGMDAPHAEAVRLLGTGVAKAKAQGVVTS